MGLEKPLTGWAGGIRRAKASACGKRKSPFGPYYGHAHNERWFDMFVKRGVIGLVGLLLFYAVPLALFWPRRPGAALMER